MKNAIAIVGLVVVVSAAAVATQAPRVPAQKPPAPKPAAAAAATPAPVTPVFDGNVASIDFGGTVETWSTDTNESLDHQEFIDGSLETNWYQNGRYLKEPGEVVLSFFAREPMLIDRVVLAAPRVGTDDYTSFPKDVEVWVSSGDSPDGPFQKVATASLPPVTKGGSATVPFTPVEARFLKFRALNNQKGVMDFLASELKVMEAKRPGYVPLTTRHPELLLPGGPNPAPPPVAPAAAAGAATPPCAPPAPPAASAHAESRRVMLLGQLKGMHMAGAIFENTRYPKGEEARGRHRVEFSLDPKTVAAIDDDVPQDERGVLTRARFRLVSPRQARPAMLAPAVGFDTVVMAQMCNVTDRMKGISPAFKQALMAWVAAGHKLVIQDSDDCVPGPDYSFVPYKFKTDTPGARGAMGFGMRFVESNSMLQPRANRPGFLDAKAWENNERHYRNELGDANTFVAWDANWCGQLTVRNINNVTGFALAYAHYGRGLIIYDGFDNDQTLERGYDEVAVRELAQGFDPDGLPCTARLADFVVVTEPALLQRGAVAGRSYTYPLTILANMGYTGTVNLSAAPVAGAPGVAARFDPPTVAVNVEGKSTLALTLPSALPSPTFAVEVAGADAAGKRSAVCLQFGPTKNGDLTVVSALPPPTKARRNLEIILDASGSMKTPLAGTRSRWAVALETLDKVLTSIPADFKVGLRIYGHRELSTSPKTCTDSELVVPIKSLDRKGLLAKANLFKPKGETPLVYSVMQSPADLKAVGGGTVILITDGEESCKGDPVKAAADLKASGLDIRLDIVGFALKDPKVQRELAGFAETTGGTFYAADSGTALADAMASAAVERFPYTVYDAAGKVVLTADAGSGADQLPSGDYKVVVKAGARDLVASSVKLGPAQSVTLTIAMKNGRLVLQ
ncbi:MAG: hypothetical protein NTV05_06935 [Acidobacteria bacterium]|nr:hypothetical protein [Acidobacteriota bacterium]